MPAHQEPNADTTTERFLHLFADIEQALKARLRRPLNDRTPVSALISGYERENLFWTSAANRLRALADIRNLLTHQRTLSHGYPVTVKTELVDTLTEMLALLREPEPVSKRFRRSVLTVSDTDCLLHVVRVAFQNGFSQFPVLDGDRFVGLITETEVTRWLGYQAASAQAIHIDLEKPTVRALLSKREPDAKEIPIFCFQPLDTPVEEVMNRFSTRPALQAVLLSKTGKASSPIEGIVTQWDAARYQWHH